MNTSTQTGPRDNESAPPDIPPLAELFCQHSHREWHFVQPGGNWGDHLIYAGAEALATRLGLNWKSYDYRDFDSSRLPAGAAIYLHGGGGFNPWGSRRAFTNLTNAIAVKDAIVIQGPQTADVLSELTGSLFAEAFQNLRAATVFIYARERNTLDFLKATLPTFVSIGLDSDTALHLHQSDVTRLAHLDSIPAGRYHLLVARDDDEVPSTQPLDDNGSVVMDPAYFAQSFEHWIRIHAFAKSIRSNRLHSAIVGALLGKPVTLMGGSYHKNRSIWEYSLKDLGVSWGEEPNRPPAKSDKPKPLSSATIFQKSWKLKRAKMWLKGVPLK